MKTKTSLLTGAAAAISLLLLAFPAGASEPVPEAQTIERMSRQASTPQDHATVAKHLRLRAEALEAKAEKHEAEAQRLRNQSANPMAAKWPAMVRNGWERESRLAIEARRAAQECYARAGRHVHLAVEGHSAAE